MKVLLVSHSSVVDVYQDKLRYLGSRHDCDLHLLIPTLYLEGSNVVEGYTGSGEYAVHRLPARFARQGRQNLHTYQGVDRLLHDLQPDIIHLEEEPESLVSRQIIKIALRLPRPPKIALFTWRNLDRPPTEWSILQPQRYIYPAVEEFVLAHTDHLIAGNQEAVDIFTKKGYQFPMTVIPQYGVNPDVYKPLPADPALKQNHGLRRTVIGYVGRMLSMKGIDTLLQAFADVATEEMSLLLLGSGSDADDLRAQAEKLGLGDQFVMIASVPAAEVVRYLNCMDIMVLPSRTTRAWKEQFGRVLIEAMACKVPVIGSSSGEIPHVIGGAGMVFAEGDAGELSRKLQRLLKDPELLRRLARNGRERVEGVYSNQRLAERIYDVYREMLAEVGSQGQASE